MESSDRTGEETSVKIDATGGVSAGLCGLASTLTGLGLSIRSGKMERRDGGGEWRFSVVNARQQKLDYNEACGLLYTLQQAHGGSGYEFLTPPL